MKNSIRIRVCVATVEQGKILLVPHYATDAGPVQWVIPGGRVEFGESLPEAAVREFFEETGLQIELKELLDISEVILPEREYHSITVAFSGTVSGGTLQAEKDHPFGEKMPRWFSTAELSSVNYHPVLAVEKALSIQKEQYK